MSEFFNEIETYYFHVAGNMATLNPSQKFGGISDARDWPQVKVRENYLYLLVVGVSPTQQGTRANPGNRYTLQWNWIVIGSDIQPGHVSANRGDKYRTNLTIQQNLTNASYPGFALVNAYTQDPTTPANLIVTPVSPQGWARWSRPDFRGTNDFKRSGVLNGIASLNLYFESDVPSSIA